MKEAATDDDAAVARMRSSIILDRDHHLNHCTLATSSGPDATLACAECGRAKWMHGTRHDTCPAFCWVTVNTVTDSQIQELRFMRVKSRNISVECSRALNDFGGYGAGVVREARRACANAINEAIEKASKS